MWHTAQTESRRLLEDFWSLKVKLKSQFLKITVAGLSPLAAERLDIFKKHHECQFAGGLHLQLTEDSGI